MRAKDAQSFFAGDRTSKPTMHSITFLVLLLIASSYLATAQERSSTQNELLESGRAKKLHQPPSTPTQIKIVSYNIRWRSGKELDQIIVWLKDRDQWPAIIGLQEVDRAKQRSGNTNNARVLAESLGMYYAWAAPPRPKISKEKEDETGVELLSPYPLSEISRIVLPHPGPGGRWRVALGATIRIGKTDLRVYSVHSETRILVAQKMEQLQAVLDDLARFPKTTPAIVMGDFNSWEPQAIAGVRKLFTSAGFTTPFADDDPTFMRNAVVFDLELKLDWIWLRGLSPHSHGIDRGLTVSDHYPLWTVVKLESR
jgi:endonuclease/exonuclease/phosphatase family metal-dependent hydrolase